MEFKTYKTDGGAPRPGHVRATSGARPEPRPEGLTTIVRSLSRKKVVMASTRALSRRVLVAAGQLISFVISRIRSFCPVGHQNLDPYVYVGIE